MSSKRRPGLTPPPTAAAAANDDLARRYDTVEYPAHAFPVTHPDRLAIIPLLCGMKPRLSDRCRVLELGCGDGINLISMAMGLPGAEFVGVDLAGAAIARGQGVVEELGLANVRLVHDDVRAVDASYGEFDYVISHGLYSWVPPDVRDGLLRVCAQRLAPQGVAYVSYNAMPGGHVRRMLREMMAFHTMGFEAPMERAAEAKAFLGFLVEGARQLDPADAYVALMKQEATAMRKKRDADIFHDELAPINDPVYVTQFAAHAAGHGLQYLGEAEEMEAREDMFVGEVAESLQEIGGQDRVLKEQYLDFLTCRYFRRTLLVRGDVELIRTFNANAVTPLFVGSDVRPVDPAEPGGFTFKGDAGGVTVKDPVFVAAMHHLQAAWPAAVPFTKLLDAAVADAGEEAPSRHKATLRLAEFVYRSYLTGLFRLTRGPVHALATAGERPVASPLARIEARDSVEVTNLRHETAAIEGPAARTLLFMLDGTRDRAQLATGLADAGHPGGDVDAALAQFARDGLLLE